MSPTPMDKARQGEVALILLTWMLNDRYLAEQFPEGMTEAEFDEFMNIAAPSKIAEIDAEFATNFLKALLGKIRAITLEQKLKPGRMSRELLDEAFELMKTRVLANEEPHEEFCGYKAGDLCPLCGKATLYESSSAVLNCDACCSRFPEKA